MKINLPNHEIKDVTHVSNGDIPLAYIDTTDASHDVKFELMEGFATDSSRKVSPYETFYDSSTILFNSDKEPLTDIVFKRFGNEYAYEPKGAIEFKPLYFDAGAVIRRTMTYDSSRIYNMKVGVLEDDVNLPFSAIMISAFGDAYKRGICPANIRVNGGAMTTPSLIAAASSQSDFLFLQSSDGVEVGDVDKDAALNKHINLWISAENFTDLFKENDVTTPTQEGQLCSFYTKTDRTKISSTIFDQSKTSSSYSDDDYTYSYPYEDVLILEKEGYGYIVITPKEFLEENLGSNTKIIYDVLMSIYMKSWRKTSTVNTWITDSVVDAMAYNYSQIKRYHKKIELKDLLEDDLNTGEYKLISITTSTTDVSFVSIVEDELFFRKTKTASKDPEKSDSAISFLSSSGNVYIYTDADVNFVTSRASLSSELANGDIVVTLEPLSDSEKKVYIKEAQSLTVPSISKTWLVCATPCTSVTQSVISLVDKDEYSSIRDGWEIAEITITPKYNTQLTDLRTSGGGLPYGEPNDYNLIDIGNINGRPYRIGSTLIIRMPKKYEIYKDRIEAAVNQHISACEYPVIIFE